MCVCVITRFPITTKPLSVNSGLKYKLGHNKVNTSTWSFHLFNLKPALQTGLQMMCDRVHVSELYIMCTLCSLSLDNQNANTFVVHSCDKTGLDRQLSTVIGVIIRKDLGTGPSTWRLSGSTLAVNHVCFSSQCQNILTQDRLDTQ